MTTYVPLKKNRKRREMRCIQHQMYRKRSVEKQNIYLRVQSDYSHRDRARVKEVHYLNVHFSESKCFKKDIALA